MSKTMKLLMIGPGAIGGTTAALIAKAGYDITIVSNRQETTKKIKENGLKISGVLGKHEQKIKAVTTVQELKGTFDIIFIATKAYDMPKVARKLLPFIHKNSLVVSMQNGICTDQLAMIVGEHRTIGCVVGYGATMIDKANLLITSRGHLKIGSVAEENKPDLHDLQKILQSVFPTKISDNIHDDLYSKLIINSCISGLGALSGLKLGKLLSLRVARKIFIAIINEAMNVAKMANIQVPPYANKIDYYKFIDGTSLFNNLRRHFIILIVGLKYRRLKSSSLQSLERGQMTEIDYFNGYIMRKGEEFKVHTPVNSQIVSLIKQIENKQLNIKPENLYKVII